MSPKDPETDQDVIVQIAERLIPIKSISTDSGGQGEKARADEICKLLAEFGYKDIQRYDYKDNSGAIRSNVVLKIGDFERTLWILSHIDTVPAGSEELWTKPPFSVTVEGGKIYGRGVADNGEGILSSLLLLKRLDKNKMRFNLGLAYVADEEMGSKYGMAPLMKENIFSPKDLIVVPDSGTMEGLEIEVAEKGTLWLKFTVKGKQGHASTPHKALNATKIGMEFALSLDEELHKKFDASDETFDYPISTFEITKHEKNVENVNTIPGLEVFYMDCRILPKYDQATVIQFIKERITEFESKFKVKIAVEIVNGEHTPPTPVDSEVFKELSKAIQSVQGKEPKPIGIGGGTVAALFRERGINAVVWGISNPDVYHQPDEYIAIDQIIRAAEVYKRILYK